MVFGCRCRVKQTIFPAVKYARGIATMTDKVAICWFRQDLRVSDNPALVAAAKHNNVLPIYILDNENPGDYAYGGASQWWLHHSLTALQIHL